MKKLFILLFFIVPMGLFATDLKRFGLIIGANNGGSERIKLRYADSDAKSIAKVMGKIGGVNKEDIILLVQPTSGEIYKSIFKLVNSINIAKAENKRVELFFYYSGHSDESGLLLGNELFSYKKLREVIKSLPADLKISMLDSCSSGAITRLKGGKKKAPFLLDTSAKMKGFAFLTSSSHDEASQESEKIKGSFFTYYFVSGLRGAADTTGDGRVTLNEVYQFAYHETLSRTEKTLGGPQHPAYEIQMSGSGDVVMTDIRKTSASLIFDKNINGRISIRNKDDVFVAELKKIKGKEIRLGLEEGKYTVLVESNRNVYETKVALIEGIQVFNVKRLKKVKILAAVSKGNQKVKYQKIPFNFSIVPGISTGDPDEGFRSKHSFSLNLFAGESHYLNGVAIGGLNIVEDKMAGVAFGYLSNYIQGDARGAAFSSFFNYSLGSFTGVQFSLVNYNESWVKGVQVSLVNHALDVKGTQLGLVNIANNINGAQLGLVNISSGKVSGTQIGLVNIADENDVPIGLVNIIKNGRFNIDIWIDETAYRFIGFKMGGKYFYTHLFFGNSFDNSNYAAYGFGLGGNIQLSEKLFLQPEISWQNYIDTRGEGRSLSKNEFPEALVSFKVALGYDLSKYVSMIGGLSFNVYYPSDEKVTDTKFNLKSSFKVDDREFEMWPGIFIGFQFF